MPFRSIALVVTLALLAVGGIAAVRELTKPVPPLRVPMLVIDPKAGSDRPKPDGAAVRRERRELRRRARERRQARELREARERDEGAAVAPVSPEPAAPPAATEPPAVAPPAAGGDDATDDDGDLGADD
jgi:hypothetical protein